MGNKIPNRTTLSWKGVYILNTVGELKDFIKNLDDNMPLVKQSDNFELHGAIDIGICPQVEKFRTETRKFMDSFDYKTYNHEIYINDENGIECFQIK